MLIFFRVKTQFYLDQREVSLELQELQRLQGLKKLLVLIWVVHRRMYHVLKVYMNDVLKLRLQE